jgi:hypothetical protein
MAEGIPGKHQFCFCKWSEVLNFINLDESDLKTAAFGLKPSNCQFFNCPYLKVGAIYAMIFWALVTFFFNF